MTAEEVLWKFSGALKKWRCASEWLRISFIDDTAAKYTQFTLLPLGHLVQGQKFPYKLYGNLLCCPVSGKNKHKQTGSQTKKNRTSSWGFLLWEEQKTTNSMPVKRPQGVRPHGPDLDIQWKPSKITETVSSGGGGHSETRRLTHRTAACIHLSHKSHPETLQTVSETD